MPLPNLMIGSYLHDLLNSLLVHFVKLLYIIFCKYCTRRSGRCKMYREKSIATEARIVILIGMRHLQGIDVSGCCLTRATEKKPDPKYPASHLKNSIIFDCADFPGTGSFLANKQVKVYGCCFLPASFVFLTCFLSVASKGWCFGLYFC